MRVQAVTVKPARARLAAIAPPLVPRPRNATLSMRLMVRGARGYPWVIRGGAPGETRTHDLLVRNQMLYPLSYGRLQCGLAATGGEGGIRTLEAGYPT